MMSMTQPINQKDYGLQGVSSKNTRHIKNESQPFGDYNTTNPNALTKTQPLEAKQKQNASEYATNANKISQSQHRPTESQDAESNNFNKTVKIVSAAQQFDSSKVTGGAYNRSMGVNNVRNVKARPIDGSIERPKIQIFTNNSKQNERTAGFNVSYDNSFSAIKSNIFNFTGATSSNAQDHAKQGKPNDQVVGSEDVPNKPQDKIIRKAIQN